jgi:hypothetical protein
MDIVTLEGFLSALAIGPELGAAQRMVAARLGWGEGPVFESTAQTQRIIGILMHRFNEICRLFGYRLRTAPVHERGGRGN